METKSRRNMFAMLAGQAAGSSVAGASDGSRERTQSRYFPNVELTTHEGKKVRFYDDLVKDKIVIINFMYADCQGICPGITANLLKVQKLLGNRIGRDIFMYSITLKPEEDSPQDLRHYAQMHGVKSGWLFLTGKPDEIDMLRRSLGFSNTNPKLDKDRSNHIGMIRYGNEAHQWWAMCPAQAHAEWIVESILWMDGPKRVQTQQGLQTGSEARTRG